ncbi:MAG TPA: LLM class F420-dependent oxidoreductase, partial [Acidimicrobiales bacterium]|nr:LLM class F420-dependent oxidoreductase [Acidimicrobiales bacterium]
MQLGLSLGYWGAQPPADLVDLVQEAERLGYDAAWTAESWGSDAFSPLVWLAAHTERIRLGTGIVQMSARTPTATAMHAVTLDHLSNGRLILGLGVSGPQVVEGWYGQPSNRPLARTREYVEILRQAFQRDDHLSFDGDFHQHPYVGEGSTGLGKPLKVMVHPLRADIPIFIGAEGPKNVTQTAEIADGWLPLYYSPYRPEVYADQLVGAPAHFEVALNLAVTVTEDDSTDAIASALAPVKAMLGFYVGGMGAKGQNF